MNLITLSVRPQTHPSLPSFPTGRLKESAPSRVVTVSSVCHAYENSLDLQDLNFEKEPYTMMAAYNKSKLCNVLFANTLAEKTAGTGEWEIANDTGLYKYTFFLI